MSKLNHRNRKTRSQSPSIAIACTPVGAIGSLGLANVGFANDSVSSSRTSARPDFDIEGGGQLSPCDKFSGVVDNRIQLANAADLVLPTAPSRAVSSVRKPISFARQLAASPMRLPAKASDPSLFARAYRLFIGIIRQLGKRLSQRHGRSRKLQLLEIQQLGEKRFVAIVRVGKQKFLIGGAAASVSLLAEIDSHKTTVIASRLLNQETA